MQNKPDLLGTAVFLAIELEQEVTRMGWLYRVNVERPGRPGAFSKEWRAPSGRLSAESAQDLCNWIQATAMNALVVWGGVQEVLDV